MTRSQSEVRKQTGKSRKIIKKVWIRASKEVVYHALTDSKDLVQWFCDRVSLEAREGGELVAHWKGEKTSQKGRAVITRMVPGSVFELNWVDEGDGVKKDGSAHTFCYEIRAKSGMTELVMTDKGRACSDDDAVSVLDQGWNSVLMELKDYCERRERSAKLRSPAKRS